MDTDSDVGSRRVPGGRIVPLQRPRSSSGAAVEAPSDSDPYAAFTLEEALDRKRLWRAALIAVAAHGLLLLVQLPAATRIAASDDDRPVLHVLEPFRFRPPEIAPERQVPSRRAHRVPMPDPTPDAPEPLRTLEDEPIVIDAIDDLPVDVPVAPEPTQPDPRYGEVLPVGGDVQKPVKIYAPAPLYTELARRARIQGLVIVEAVIDREGKVTSAEIVRGLPMGLNEAALAAVRQWRFAPGTLHGRPVAVAFTLTVRFEIH